MVSYDPKWLPIIQAQERLLYFDRFSNRDALQIGLNAVAAADELGYAFAIRVIANGAIVFSHHMDGTSRNNDWWMDKKLNTALLTGISTLRHYVEIEGGVRPRPDFLDFDGNYATDGGCVPMRMRDGRIFGYVIASGAPHALDHEVATRAIARFLNIEVPSILD